MRVLTLRGKFMFLVVAAFCNYSPMARSEATVQPLTAKAIEVKGR